MLQHMERLHDEILIIPPKISLKTLCVTGYPFRSKYSPKIDGDFPTVSYLGFCASCSYARLFVTNMEFRAHDLWCVGILAAHLHATIRFLRHAIRKGI